MRFLIDAQLPRRIALRFREAGHDAVHTLDLPARNRTPDAEIVKVATEEKRVVVTKDADFVISFTTYRQPEKLLLISTGNIINAHLEALLQANITVIVAALEEAGMVELTRTALILHS